MAVVLDTSVIWPYLAEPHPRHRRATRLVEELSRGRLGPIMTNDLVYAEATAIAAKESEADVVTAVRAVDGFFFGEATVVEVARVDQRAFAQARDRLLASPGRGLSLADWSLVVLAERVRAEAIATFDARLGAAYKRQVS